MAKDDRYHQLYDSLLEEVNQIHLSIQRSIKKGLWALVGVTVFFFALMFFNQGSKVIFLLFWIVTMFALSAFLIALDYFNYEMQKRLEHATQREQNQLSEVIELPTRESIQSRLNAIQDKLRKETSSGAEATAEESTEAAGKEVK